MRAWVVAAIFIAACGDDDGDGLTADASVDTPSVHDAPFECTPVAPAPPGPACLALEPAALAGTTPLGTLDAELAYVGAGDCLTISQATIHWVGACGEEIWLRFSYPVSSGADGKRFVPASFDADARLELAPVGAQPLDHLTRIHVEVVEWREGDGLHDLDITVTFTEADFTVAPIHVQGTFCDWPYHLC